MYSIVVLKDFVSYLYILIASFCCLTNQLAKPGINNWWSGGGQILST